MVDNMRHLKTIRQLQQEIKDLQEAKELMAQVAESMLTILRPWDAGMRYEYNRFQFKCSHCGAVVTLELVEMVSKKEMEQLSYHRLHSADCPVYKARLMLGRVKELCPFHVNDISVGDTVYEEIPRSGIAMDVCPSEVLKIDGPTLLLKNKDNQLTHWASRDEIITQAVFAQRCRDNYY